MPRRVRIALVLLWAAWLVSLCAWIAHLYEARDAGADLYSVVGFPAALVQAFLVYLIGRGNNVARILVVVVAIPAFVIAQVFFAARFDFSSLRIGVEAVMRGTALIILLTPVSARWFGRRQS